MKLRNLLKSKKGMSLDQAPQLIMLLVIIAIVGAVGLLVLGGVSTGITDSTAQSAIGNVTLAISNFFSMTPVLGTIFIAVILLAAIVGLGYFAYSRGR